MDKSAQKFTPGVPRRRLGQGLEVSAIGLGCMEMSWYYGAEGCDDVVGKVIVPLFKPGDLLALLRRQDRAEFVVKPQAFTRQIRLDGGNCGRGLAHRGFGRVVRLDGGSQSFPRVMQLVEFRDELILFAGQDDFDLRLLVVGQMQPGGNALKKFPARGCRWRGMVRREGGERESAGEDRGGRCQDENLMFQTEMTYAARWENVTVGSRKNCVETQKHDFSSD